MDPEEQHDAEWREASAVGFESGLLAMRGPLWVIAQAPTWDSRGASVRFGGYLRPRLLTRFYLFGVA